MNMVKDLRLTLKPGDTLVYHTGTPLYKRDDHQRHVYTLMHDATFVLTPEDAWTNTTVVSVHSDADGEEFEYPNMVVVTNTYATARMLA